MNEIITLLNDLKEAQTTMKEEQLALKAENEKLKAFHKVLTDLLEQIKLHKGEETFNGKETLTSSECAKYLGVTRTNLYRLTSRREIPHSKPLGKQVYFNKTEIDQWVMRNRVATEEELKAKATKVMSNLNKKKML